MRIILKKQYDWRELARSDLEQGQLMVTCEPLCSKRFEEFLDQLRSCWLLLNVVGTVRKRVKGQSMSLLLADIQKAAYATSALTAASQLFGFYVYPGGARLRIRGAVPQFLHTSSQCYAVMVQFSLPYYKSERANVLCSFILVFFFKFAMD